MHHTNKLCDIKSFNANKIEEKISNYLINLSDNESFINMTIDELNSDITKKVEPLEKEAKLIKKHIDELNKEIERYIEALGKGKLSIQRLENMISKKESEIKKLQAEYEYLKSQINENMISEYNAEIVKSCLRDLKKTFDLLTPKEKAEALQCIIKDIEVYKDKLVLNIYEIPEFKRGSQKNNIWLRW